MHDLVIIGGGAAGLFAACQAIKKGLDVAIVEVNDRVGKKILATGNGRCNLAASHVTAHNYNTDIISDIINKYPVQSVLRDFEDIGLFTRCEDGRIYPYSSLATSVLNVLREGASGARVYLSCPAEEIIKTSRGYKVVCGSTSVEGKNVCLASGSQATFGSAGYKLLSNFGCRVNSVVPSLLPIAVVCDGVKGMQGVRQTVSATLIIGGKDVYTECGEMQFKDKAISGIVTFNLSARLAWSGASKCQVRLDFAPDMTIGELRAVIARCGINNMYHKSIVEKLIARGGDIVSVIKSYTINCQPIIDIAKGQVASGGIDLGGVDMRSMQIKGHKGLYAIGEVLDVDGVCGGYNLYWAWVSAKNMIDNMS